MLPIGARTVFRALRTRAASQIGTDWVWPYWLRRQIDPDVAGVRAPRPSPVPDQRHRPQLDQHRQPRIGPRGRRRPSWPRVARGSTDGRSTGGSVPRTGGTCRPTSANVRQTLIGDSPVVETRMRVPGGDIIHRAYAIKATAADGGRELVIVEIENDSAVPVALALAVRPYDVEGLSVIERIELHDTTVTVDGRVAMLLPRPPNEVAASTFHDGDSAATVFAGEAGSRRSRPGSACEAGHGPGRVRLPAAAPRHAAGRPADGPGATHPPRRPGPPPGAARPGLPAVDPVGRTGRQRLEGPDRPGHAPRPARRAAAVGRRRQPPLPAAGPRRRRHHAGPAHLPPLLVPRRRLPARRARPVRLPPRGPRGAGVVSRTASTTTASSSRSASSGTPTAPRCGPSRHHWDLTRDDDLLDELAPSVAGGVEWIERKRTTRRRRGDPALAGLLPAGISAEHLGPHDYFYWDDFWALAGLRDGARLLRAAGEDRGRRPRRGVPRLDDRRRPVVDGHHRRAARHARRSRRTAPPHRPRRHRLARGGVAARPPARRRPGHGGHRSTSCATASASTTPSSRASATPASAPTSRCTSPSPSCSPAIAGRSTASTGSSPAPRRPGRGRRRSIPGSPAAAWATATTGGRRPTSCRSCARCWSARRADGLALVVDDPRAPGTGRASRSTTPRPGSGRCRSPCAGTARARPCCGSSNPTIPTSPWPSPVPASIRTWRIDRGPGRGAPRCARPARRRRPAPARRGLLRMSDAPAGSPSPSSSDSELADVLRLAGVRRGRHRSRRRTPDCSPLLAVETQVLTDLQLRHRRGRQSVRPRASSASAVSGGRSGSPRPTHGEHDLQRHRRRAAAPRSPSWSTRDWPTRRSSSSSPACIGSSMARIANAQAELLADPRRCRASSRSPTARSWFGDTFAAVLGQVWRRHLQAAARARLAGPLAIGDRIDAPAAGRRVRRPRRVHRPVPAARQRRAGRGRRPVRDGRLRHHRRPRRPSGQDDRRRGDVRHRAIRSPRRDCALDLAESYHDADDLSDVRVGLGVRPGDRSRRRPVRPAGQPGQPHHVRSPIPAPWSSTTSSATCSPTTTFSFRTMLPRRLKHIGLVRLHVLRAVAMRTGESRASVAIAAGPASPSCWATPCRLGCRRGRVGRRHESPDAQSMTMSSRPSSRVGIAQVERLERVDQDRGHRQVAVPLAVGGHDVPGRVVGGRLGDGLFVDPLVVVPELALVEVARGELPALVRLVEASLEAFLLLVLARCGGRP